MRIQVILFGFELGNSTSRKAILRINIAYAKTMRSDIPYSNIDIHKSLNTHYELCSLIKI